MRKAEKGLFTHSAGSRRRNKSMAAENAANATPPPNAAWGPEFRARIPPAMNPAATEFAISFFARYFHKNMSQDIAERTNSNTHPFDHTLSASE